jgi:pyruvate/2-oxoglutarate dehydrogenase complex dihydrolipoamide dehydrogenase (E3) component
LQNAGIKVKDNRIAINKHLQTTNKRIFVCGDIAGTLKFSHAAEQHARLISNNLFSPFKKKLDNSKMSWVTFSDPQVATFGHSERQLLDQNTPFEKLTMDFTDDDRAIVDEYQYGKLILLISKSGIFKKAKILGGSMIAPDAGELIQELVLANLESLSINSLFNKIYAYPVASRVNQMIIVKHKEKQLTERITKVLRLIFRIFN